MPIAVVTMPDIDIQEGLTRKLGPLPAWGWGIAIAGAVLVFRVFGSRSDAGGTVVGSGGSVASDNLGAGDTGSDDFQGSSSLVSQLMADVNAAQKALEEGAVTDASLLERLNAAQAALAAQTAINTTQTGLIGGLTTKVGSISSINTLQTKLLEALKQRDQLLHTNAILRLQRNSLNDALRACRTASCRTNRNKSIAAVNRQLAANGKATTTQNTLIASLQKQIGAING